MDDRLDEARVNELIDMIDSLMEKGTERLHVKADDEKEDITASTSSSSDACERLGACAQPTEHAIDFDDADQ